ncbi:MAG TPA: MFS transporter [Vicinamibacteria bacterium]|nr:MFS transporter [Vicinamibacteria bacterium]
MVGTVFVVYTGFAFVLPFLPLYVRELGVEDDVAAARWAGLLIGVAPLLAGLLAPLWGRLGDRHGHKGVILLALLASAFFLGLSAFVRSPLELLWLRIGTGLFGGVGPLSLAMATSLGRRSETGQAVGLVQAAQILAAAVGPLGGGLLADRVGIRSTFLVTALLCFGAVVLVAALYDSPQKEPATKDRTPFFALLSLPGTRALVAVSFLVNFVGRSLTPILPLQLEGLGIPRDRLSSSTGALISTYAVAAALSAVLLGRASRSRAPGRLLPGTLLAGGLTVLPMAHVAGYSPFLVLAGLLGLASGGSLTLCYTLGGLLVPEAARATAFGFFSGAALFGGALSPSVAGFLAQWDYRGIYYLDTAILLGLGLGLGLSSRVGKRQPGGHPQ